MTSKARYSLKREFWRPDEHRVWVRKQPPFGRWGWNVNFAELVRRAKARRAKR